MFLTPEHGDGI
jgi:hypothetical protein